MADTETTIYATNDIWRETKFAYKEWKKQKFENNGVYCRYMED
jgi:hypothetical protein